MFQTADAVSARALSARGFDSRWGHRCLSLIPVRRVVLGLGRSDPSLGESHRMSYTVRETTSGGKLLRFLQNNVPNTTNTPSRAFLTWCLWHERAAVITQFNCVSALYCLRRLGCSRPLMLTGDRHWLSWANWSKSTHLHTPKFPF
jgi:hypothetical protein